MNFLELVANNKTFQKGYLQQLVGKKRPCTLQFPQQLAGGQGVFFFAQPRAKAEKKKKKSPPRLFFFAAAKGKRRRSLIGSSTGQSKKKNTRQGVPPRADAGVE